MTEGKTVGQLSEEHGLTLAELAGEMEISERDLMLLESSGQKYLGLGWEWRVPVAKLFGEHKVFWYPPQEAVEEWKRAVGVLDGLIGAAEAMDSEPLTLSLSEAIVWARQELDGCR
jgi:hypothetical protein